MLDLLLTNEEELFRGATVESSLYNSDHKVVGFSSLSEEKANTEFQLQMGALCSMFCCSKVFGPIRLIKEEFVPRKEVPCLVFFILSLIPWICLLGKASPLMMLKHNWE